MGSRGVGAFTSIASRQWTLVLVVVRHRDWRLWLVSWVRDVTKQLHQIFFRGLKNLGRGRLPMAPRLSYRDPCNSSPSFYVPLHARIPRVEGIDGEAASKTRNRSAPIKPRDALPQNLYASDPGTGWIFTSSYGASQHLRKAPFPRVTMSSITRT